MYPSKTPLLFIFMVAAIVAAVVATLAYTKNPLALLGLYFLPQVPVVNQPPSLEDLRDAYGDEEEGQPMGFTAELKKS